MVANNSSAKKEQNAPASLEILTGPARGTASWLSGSALDISLNEEDMIRVAEAGSGSDADLGRREGRLA